MTNQPAGGGREGIEGVAGGEGPRRGALRGSGTCVIADHPLAAAAGQRALHDGGSAADAAVAMAAVLTVTQPFMSHLGGDSFATVYDAATGAVEALNSSGPAPASADAAAYRELGGIPDTGALAVTVPGCVAGWGSLHERYGKLPWSRLLEDAERIAREGFPASRALARAVSVGRERVYPAGAFKESFGHVHGDGGQQVVQPELSATLRSLAEGGAAAFYEGDIADACLATLSGLGAAFTPDDWRAPAEWVKPLSVEFGGMLVHTQPPPSRGLVTMLALRRLARSEGGIGAQVEALREAFAAVDAEAGDPRATSFDAAALLRAGGAPAQAGMAAGGDGDTTALLAIDAEGNAVSLIQSVFSAWGSGVLSASTGVVFNNRVRGFSLEEGHPNELAGGKRPMHTLHNYIVTSIPDLPLAGEASGPRDGELVAVGGTPGAHRQPQTNVQVLDAVLRRGADPQDALDAARWALDTDGSLYAESRTPDSLGDALRAEELAFEPLAAWDGWTGRACLAVLAGGGIAAAHDLRGEGLAIVG
ncbi:MAG: gamma-glutamyltransferase [Chloroflexi bacterium]|nr:gamma-glutamyltransferase [Chloroflexota bacterium]